MILRETNKNYARANNIPRIVVLRQEQELTEIKTILRMCETILSLIWFIPPRPRPRNRPRVSLRPRVRPRVSLRPRVRPRYRPRIRTRPRARPRPRRSITIRIRPRTRMIIHHN